MRFKREYRLAFDNVSRLERIFEVRRPLWVFACLGILVICGLLFLAGIIVFISPLRTLLPGYLAETQRNTAIENLMRLDSLQTSYENNKAYLDNILTVLNTNRRPTDSVRLVVNQNPMTTDSLISPSEAERRFVANMQEREKFNISILAPLAAEGINFIMPAEKSVFREKSVTSPTLEIMVPHGEAAAAIADGTVLDCQYAPKERGFSIIVQHGNGFTSRIGHIDRPFVGIGDKVRAGQPLGIVASDANNTGIVTLRMWRNGDALLPANMLQPSLNPKRSATPDEENQEKNASNRRRRK